MITRGARWVQRRTPRPPWATARRAWAPRRARARPGARQYPFASPPPWRAPHRAPATCGPFCAWRHDRRTYCATQAKPQGLPRWCGQSAARGAARAAWRRRGGGVVGCRELAAAAEAVMRQAARGSPKGQQRFLVAPTSARRPPNEGSATTNNQNDNTPKFNMANYSASAPGNARTQQFTATLVAVVGARRGRARTSARRPRARSPRRRPAARAAPPPNRAPGSASRRLHQHR